MNFFMEKQVVDILTGTTECDVDWRMLNMNAELVASSLTTTFRPGLHTVLRPYWKFNVNSGDGVAPINHILKFETFGHRCPLGTKLRQESQIRLVTTRDDVRTLKRCHLVLTCQLFKEDSLVGRSEFWLALTRLLAPPGERTPSDVPAGLKFLREHALGEDDLLSRDIESYRCEGNDEKLTHDVLCVFTTARATVRAASGFLWLWKRAVLWRTTCKLCGKVCKVGNIVEGYEGGFTSGVELKMVDGGCVARELGFVIVFGGISHYRL